MFTQKKTFCAISYGLWPCGAWKVKFANQSPNFVEEY